MYKFGDYLRICREQLGFTQEQLVGNLIKKDIAFKSLDTTTFGRWERGSTKPSISKQTKIMFYFYESFDLIFPFIRDAKHCLIEKSLCALGFARLVSKHNLVLDFPTHQMEESKFQVSHVKDSALKEIVIKKNIVIFKELYDKEINFDKHSDIANRSANYFSVCTYDEEYYGHLCLIKLKNQAYEKLINFEMSTDEIEPEDFASVSEKGQLLFFGFFGMSDLIMSMLTVHLYSHLIKHQAAIDSIGAIIATDGGKKIAVGLGLDMNASATVGEIEFSSYDATLLKLLLREPIIKMLFNPEACLEEK